MARADRRRSRSAKGHAGPPRRDSDLAAIEDTLFFTRIRQHAKWVFVFLALSFLIGFVVFNVGGSGTAAASASFSGTAETGRAGTSRSLTRASRCRRPRRARRHSGTSRPRSRTTARPTRRSWRSRAIWSSSRRTRTRCASSPASTSGRAASSPRRRRSPSCAPATPRSAARSARRSTSARAPRSARDPIDEAIATQASQAVSEAYTKAQTAFQSAEQTYERLVVLAPKDPEHPARARPGGAAERRHCHGDRRVSDVLEARPGRPERGDRQAADRAAEGPTGLALVGLDSPPSGNTTPSCTRTAGAHIR